MDLEKAFVQMELQGVLPRGERMTPIAGQDSGNTLIWQGHFENLEQAEKALRIMATNPQHVELFNQQAPLIENTWVEFYEVLEL